MEQWLIAYTDDVDPGMSRHLKELLDREATASTTPVDSESEPDSQPGKEPDDAATIADAEEVSTTRGVLEPGARCGPFRIEEKIAEGGMGNVYFATRDDDLDLKVALKTLFCWHQGALNQFKKESKILSGLKHPNIAHLIDAGILASGQPWLAVEYVEGQTLDVYLAKRQPDFKARLQLFLKICDALSHAHQQMVIHKDLKPWNIMVMADGEPKLLDFGVAATLNPETGEQFTMAVGQDRMMTPEYASPEQIKGMRLNAASDVFSLGVLLYEMLTGRRPYIFRSRQILDLVHLIDQVSIAKPSTVRPKKGSLGPFSKQLRGDLDTILLKALERDPKRRYSSVEALAADIRGFLLGLPIAARPATRTYRLRKFIARNPWPVSLGLGLSVFLLLFTAYAQHQRSLLTMERDLATREKRTAEHITDFLVSLFEQADPDLAPSGEVSAFEVVENGRRQVDVVLADQAEVQARLMTTMGRVYRALGHHEASQELLAQAVSRLEGIGGDLDPARLELVRTLQERGDYESAEAQLDRMAGALGAQNDPLKRARLDHAKGRLWFLRGSYLQASDAYDAVADRLDLYPLAERLVFRRDRAELLSALALSDRAIEELQALLGDQREHYGPTHSEVARTLAAMGEEALYKGDLDEAERFFEQSEAMYRKLFGDRHPHIVGCLIRRGRVIKGRGDYEKAEPLYREARALAETSLGENHPEVASTISELGVLLHDKGDFPEAEDLLRKALAMRLDLLGDRHPAVAGSLIELAILLNHKTDFAAAEPMYRRALAMNLDIFGEKHPDVATALNDLALFLGKKGDYEEAEALFRRALDMRTELLGPRHIAVAECLNNIAALKRMQGEYQEAIAMFRKALDLYVELLGERHPSALHALNNLAVMLHLEGDYEAAETLYRRNLAISTELLGEDHPDVALHRYNLSFLLRVRGDYTAAGPILEQALAGYQKSFGPDHIQIMKCIHGLGDLARLGGDLALAESHYRESLAMGERLLKDKHVYLTHIRTMLAKLLVLRGKLDEAGSLLRRAEADAGTLQDNRHLVRVRYEKAHWARLRGDLEEAESLAREVLLERRKFLKENHAGIAGALVTLAHVLVDSGRPEEALPLVEEAESIFAEAFMPDHEKQYTTASLRGQILFRLGRVGEAGPVLEQAYDALVTRLGKTHYDTRDAELRLAEARAPSEERVPSRAKR
ncbi:tetratricopeptide repeat protein [Sulfidibacter corallicola]|uniref:Tetratricopeptide repeat protein n=1 Tax=Sulfidibacter corallicola TaxID=2818388 RepID=A0A8A4TRR7_SULCO|nr:tetratricopeptide repeat protein [Sulfidibacter corallicola]QTD51701.1 tetratricopeptide repeat protein [Sulfidibacter corallicola]